VKDLSSKGGEGSSYWSVFVNSVCRNQKTKNNLPVKGKAPTPITNTNKIEEEKI